MVPLIVLTLMFGVAMFATSRRGESGHPDVAISLRIAIGAMFLVTGISHFVGMREQMIEMVPEWLPAPDLIVTGTGLLQLAAAVAMVSRRLAPWAALGLTALLIAMFPANINLALTGTDLPWTSTLVPRTIIQLIFLAATASLAILGFARRNAEHPTRV